MKILFVLLIIISLFACIEGKKTEVLKEVKMNKLINLDEKSWEKLNIFFSKLYQYDLFHFEQDKLSDDEMIKFAVIYNLLNLPENIENFNDSEIISANAVNQVIKKYFGKDFTNHKTIVFFKFSFLSNIF